MEKRKTMTIKRSLVFLFVCVFLALLSLIFCNVYIILTSSLESRLFYYIILEAAAVFLLSILIFFCFLVLKRNVLEPLTGLKEGIQVLKKGSDSSYRFNLSTSNELGEIACAFNEITCDLEASNKKLEAQSSEILQKNWELLDANSQLESSYGQLQAIIEQLNETEEKYHSLIRNIPEMVCVIDNSGLISFANHVCTDVLGYEKSELVGRNILDLLDERSNPVNISNILSGLEGKNSLHLELHFIRNDQKVIITEATFTNYVYNGISMGLQAIIRDISRKREMEEEIIQSNKELGILNSVSKSITSTLDIEELSKLVVNEITDTLECPACILSLIDSSSSNLHTAAFSGTYFQNREMVRHFENINYNKSFLSKSIEKHQIYKASDIHEISQPKGIKASNTFIEEFLFMPIKVKNKNIGVLAIGSSSAIKNNDINLISSIANSAAVAIDNALLYDTSKKYFFNTIDALIAAVEAKDKYTEGHSQRVSKYATSVAKVLKLPKEQIEDIKIAGILHDIGKIGISDNILLKPDKLSAEEYELIKQHPLISNKILYPVGFSDRTLKAIAFHHERYDGKGYPYGLSGNDITLEAQIIAVADAYDAMTSNRSYRLALGKDIALRELISNKSTQFNPQLVDCMVEVVNNKNS